MGKIVLLLVFTLIIGCRQNKGLEVKKGNVDIISVVKNSYAGTVQVSTSGDNILIKSTGLPNHKTPYWGADHEMYESFPDDHKPNRNATMSAKNYTMTIPSMPVEATYKEETSMGPIGLALTGVPIFNDREGGNRELDALTITTFDKAGAHPAPHEDYHYHVTGAYTTMDDANLVGFLRDGFPIYGRKDMDGTYPSDLDDNGGHMGKTNDFSQEIYHYHTSNENYLNTGFYILKKGAYHGVKGRFVR